MCRIPKTPANRGQLDQCSKQSVQAIAVRFQTTVLNLNFPKLCVRPRYKCTSSCTKSNYYIWNDQVCNWLLHLSDIQSPHLHLETAFLLQSQHFLTPKCTKAHRGAASILWQRFLIHKSARQRLSSDKKGRRANTRAFQYCFKLP